MDPPHSVWVADDQVTEMNQSVLITLPMSFGLVTLILFSLAVMSGTFGVCILRLLTLEIFGLDFQVGLAKCARQEVNSTTEPMETMK